MQKTSILNHFVIEKGAKCKKTVLLSIPTNKLPWVAAHAVVAVAAAAAAAAAWAVASVFSRLHRLLFLLFGLRLGLDLPLD